MTNYLILIFIQACLSGSLPLVNISKWLPQEEKQVYGTDEKTPFISSCHQVLSKVIWSFQVYLGTINLTLIQPNVQVVKLTGEIVITTVRVTVFSLKENSHGGADHDQILPTTHSGG